LRGPSPRLFFPFKSPFAAGITTSRAGQPAKSAYPASFFFDTRSPTDYKLVIEPQSAAFVGEPQGSFLALNAFLSERPHECQIGSGEGIRTSVRKTFESHWLRSSVSQWAFIPAFSPVLAAPTRIRNFWFGPTAGRSQIRALAALVFARQAGTHATKTGQFTSEHCETIVGGLQLLVAPPADLSAPGHERAFVAA
jgi:hypothetical protein